MCNYKHTPDPVAGSGVLEVGVDTTENHTAFLQVKHLEEAILRGLLECQAKQVVALSTNLVKDDFPDLPHRTIMHAIVTAAAALVRAEEGERAVTVEIVQISLRNTVKHSRDALVHTLFQVMTGYPPAWHDLQILVAELHLETLRRAVDGYGRSLLAAADGPVDELVAAMKHGGRLASLARRAGLEVA